MVTSPVEQVTVRGALPRYALTAVLARTADAGAGVGVVLLAATGLGGARLGGLLAAALTAPHLLGTRIGRLVDRARDPRRPLAAGCAGYASALVVATGALVLGSPWIGAVALLAAGACGPLLTGGFSSLTSGLGASPERARGIDTLTYGVAGTAGPAVVAGVAALASPATSLLVLAGAVVLAAIGARSLPVARASRAVSPRRRGKPVAADRASAAAGHGDHGRQRRDGGMLAVLAVLLVVPVTGRQRRRHGPRPAPPSSRPLGCR